MRSRPMIASGVTSGLLDAIDGSGGDSNGALEDLGLESAVFSRAEAFIPCASFARLLEKAAAVTNDDAFGLHFGARSNPKTVGPLVYAVINSPTVSAAFETASRYIHLHNEA